MARIVTTRAPTRPQRLPEGEREPLDPHVTSTTLPGIEARGRPLAPIGRRGGDLDNDTHDDGGEEISQAEAPRGVFAGVPIGAIGSLGVETRVSAAAIARLASALEDHGQRHAIAHDKAIDVLKRLRGLVEQVTERRTWPKVPRVRRRPPRRKRQQQ